MSGAKAAFQAGTVSFNEADYPRAILYWEDAFRRDCSATSLLFNLARAYELNGQKRQALVALETFLEREPNSSERPQIVRRIEVLKKAIESEPAPTPTPAPTAGTTTPPPTQPSEPLPPPAKVQGRPILPLIIGGVGGALFVIGGISYLGASAEVKKYEDNCENPEERTGCPEDEIRPAEDARKQQQSATVITLIGLPIMAGGLIWYFAQPEPASASTRVTPTVSQNFVGLSVDGNF